MAGVQTSTIRQAGQIEHASRRPHSEQGQDEARHHRRAQHNSVMKYEAYLGPTEVPCAGLTYQGTWSNKLMVELTTRFSSLQNFLYDAAIQISAAKLPAPFFVDLEFGRCH